MAKKQYNIDIDSADKIQYSLGQMMYEDPNDLHALQYELNDLLKITPKAISIAANNMGKAVSEIEKTLSNHFKELHAEVLRVANTDGYNKVDGIAVSGTTLELLKEVKVHLNDDLKISTSSFATLKAKEHEINKKSQVR